MAEQRKQVLVAQQQAILDYLDALLRELPEEYPDEEAVTPAAPAPVKVAAEAPPPVVARVEAEPIAKPAPVQVREREEIQEWDPQALAAAAPPEPEPAPRPRVAEVPAWAEPDFQALLFEVEGLKLAVPLVKLHSVVEWTDQVTPVPGQPQWCHGLLRYRERNVRVVDTARLVLPEDKRRGEEPRHILVVGDGSWALSCSSIGNVIKLAPNEVKWRSASGQRPWLAGTVLHHLCALLETEAFAQMLANKERLAARAISRPRRPLS